MTHARDRLLHPILLLLAAAGVAAALALGGETFPAATIDLTVGRAEAEARALAFLQARGVSAAGRWRSVSFETDPAQDYLAAAAGLPELRALSAQDLNLARWRVRLFTPLDPDEWSVAISSRTGRVLGFRHTVREEDPGADLPYAQALAAARAALGQREDPGPLVLVEHTRVARPARSDQRFVWERPGLRRGEATYRYAVTVQGGAVGAVQESYQLPASWGRQAAWHARRGALVSLAGWALAMALAAALGVAWLWAAGRGLLRLRFAATALAAVCAAALAVALNSAPLLLRDYPADTSLAAYAVRVLLGYGGTLAGVAGAIVLGGMAGEALLLRGSGGRVSLSRLVTAEGLASRPAVRAVLAGACVGAAQLGYVTLFYWVGRRWLGVWYPVSPEYSDLLSTPLPWLYALAIGLLPACAEELLFRLGGITLIRRATGMPRLAVAATALVWAALHATYSQQPFFVRVLELSLVGAAFGALYLRYGILASVAAHYTYNAAVTLPALAGGDWPARAGAMAAVCGAALLLLPALARRLRGLPLAGEEALAAPQREPPGAGEGDAGVAAAPPRTPPAPVQRVRLPSGWGAQTPAAAAGSAGARGLWLPALAGCAALALALALAPPPPAASRPLTRGEAVAAGAAAARALGQPVDGLVGAAWPTDAMLNLDQRYLRDRPGPAGAAAEAARAGLRAGWFVRFRQWDRDDLLTLWLAQDGRLLAAQRALPEDAPGASLAQPSALALAEGALRRQGVDPAVWRLVDEATITRTLRVDHSFTWELERPLGEAGRQRVTVGVQGARVGLIAPHHWTPPDYRRARERTTLGSLLASSAPAIPAAAGLLLSAVALLLPLRPALPPRLRRLVPQARALPLRRMVAVGLAGGALSLAAEALRLGAWDLAEPPRLAQALSAALYAAVPAGAELALAYGVWAALAPERRAEPGALGALARAAAALPALLAAAAVAAAAGALPGDARGVEAVGGWLPAGLLLAQGGYGALRAALLACAAAALLGAWPPLRRLAWPAAALGAALALAAPERAAQLPAAAAAWALLLLAAHAARGRPLALALWAAAVLPAALLLAGMARPWYAWSGWAALLLLAAGAGLAARRPWQGAL